MKNKTINDFMTGLLPDFYTLLVNLRRIHPEWSVREAALNIMEFGRGQYSGIEEYRPHDIEMMNHFIDAINYDDDLHKVFAAYSAGCILGLEHSGKIEADRLAGMLADAAAFVGTMQLQFPAAE